MSIQVNAFANVVWKIAAILFRPQCVDCVVVGTDVVLVFRPTCVHPTWRVGFSNQITLVTTWNKFIEITQRIAVRLFCGHAVPCKCLCRFSCFKMRQDMSICFWYISDEITLTIYDTLFTLSYAWGLSGLVRSYAQFLDVPHCSCSTMQIQPKRVTHFCWMYMMTIHHTLLWGPNTIKVR